MVAVPGPDDTELPPTGEPAEPAEAGEGPRPFADVAATDPEPVPPERSVAEEPAQAASTKAVAPNARAMLALSRPGPIIPIVGGRFRWGHIRPAVFGRIVVQGSHAHTRARIHEASIRLDTARHLEPVAVPRRDTRAAPEHREHPQPARLTRHPPRRKPARRHVPPRRHHPRPRPGRPPRRQHHRRRPLDRSRRTKLDELHRRPVRPCAALVDPIVTRCSGTPPRASDGAAITGV